MQFLRSREALSQEMPVNTKTPSKPITPRDLQAIWLLLKNRTSFSIDELAVIGKAIFLLATADDIRDSLEIASRLKLVKQTGSKWLRTEYGKQFAATKNWRLWTVPDCLT